VKRLTSAVLVLLLLAGCAKTPGSEPGPVHKWFNPYGQKVEDVVPDKCSPAEVPPPADVPPKLPAGAVPQGWHHATYTLSVDAVKIVDPLAWQKNQQNFDLTYCIPVSLFAYVTAAGMPATMVEFRDTGLSQHTLPWSALRNTPWRSTIVVSWSPTTAPPVMNFELSARYETGEGLNQAPIPENAKVGLMCRIRQEGISFSMGISLDVATEPSQVRVGGIAEYVRGPFVRCKPSAFTAVPGK